MNATQKGFTLIELLIVIAIVAVLSVVVILTLNPAELLRQARDTNRISDLSTIKSALSIYLADVSTPVMGTYGVCYASIATTTPAACTGLGISTASAATVTGTVSRAVNGMGWLPVNFDQVSTGAPLGNLPVDPTNNSTYYYVYVASTSRSLFEINAKMESTRYSDVTTGVVGSDGGNTTTTYEVGNAPGLSL